MRLVATAFADTPAELTARVAEAMGRLGAQDLVEARLDLCGRPLTADELGSLARTAGGLLLATCRRGGPGSPPTEAERLELLSRAVREGARAVDLEEDAARIELGHAVEFRSLHLDAEPSPEQAAAAVRRLVRSPAGVLKLAAPCEDASSGLRWIRAAREAGRGRSTALVPMGPAGRGLRLLAARDLSDFAYCGVAEPAAAGQPLLEDVIGTYRLPAFEADSPLHAIVGHPLTATWTPRLHSALQDDLDSPQPGLTVPLPVRRVEDVLPLLDELAVEGAAVTMPHKQALASRLSRLSERARRSGSVNTIRRSGSDWEGESFDGPAAVAALRTVLDPASATVAILGAGGAAAALAAELAPLGGRVLLLARRPGQARGLAERLGVEHAPLVELEALRAEAVVNATPAEPAEPLATRVAFDMRTTPPDTAWLARAAERGIRTVDGLSMLARQAAAQRRWWGRIHSDDQEVEARLRAIVARRRGSGP